MERFMRIQWQSIAQVSGALLLSAAALWGQETLEVVELDVFAVEETERASLDSLNPTERTIDGTFFNGMTPLEIPRALLQLSPRAMELLQIDDFSDLEKVGAGTERYNFYGVAGAPVIRGWQGSTYFNGMLRAYQRNEMPTSFGSLEALDIVKGPAPAQMITSHVGGYANMIPKAPYFDEPRGSVEVKMGSHDFLNAQIDYGAPFLLGDKTPAAFRLSLTWQDAESYYDNVRNDYISAYGALKVRLSDNLRLYTGGEYFEFRSNENVGWNRPSQNLIDKGQYVIGEPLSLVRSSVGGIADRDYIGDYGKVPSDRKALFRALVVPASVVDAAVSNGSLSTDVRNLLVDMSDATTRAAIYEGMPTDMVQTDSGYVYTPDYFLAGGEVFTAPIDGRTVLSDSSDFADSRDFIWFVDIDGRPSAQFTWKHQLFIESLDTSKRSSHGYALESEQRVIDNRLTLTNSWIGNSLSGKIGYGAQIRYSEALQLQDFWSEPFARRDLLNPASPNARILSGGQINPNTSGDYWRGGFGAGGPGAHAVRSTNLQSAFFAMAEISWEDRFTLITGLRGERADFTAEAPSEAGYDASKANRSEGDITFLNWSLQPIWRVTEQISLYGVYQEATTFHPTQAGAVLGEANFGASDLNEAGAKCSLFDGTLFASVAYYEWTQDSFSDVNEVSQRFTAKGWEFETVWQPTSAWSVIASYGDRVIRKLGILGFRTVPYSMADPTGGGDAEIGLALQSGQLFSSISNAAKASYADPSEIATPSANPDLIQGSAPERTAKLFLVYEHTGGWGVGGGPVWRSGFWNNYDRTLWVDEVVLWNGQIFYEREAWSIRINIENLTDERYFLGAEPEFGANTLITQGPGRSYELSVRLAF